MKKYLTTFTVGLVAAATYDAVKTVSLKLYEEYKFRKLMEALSEEDDEDFGDIDEEFVDDDLFDEDEDDVEMVTNNDIDVDEDSIITDSSNDAIVVDEEDEEDEIAEEENNAGDIDGNYDSATATETEGSTTEPEGSAEPTDGTKTGREVVFNGVEYASKMVLADSLGLDIRTIKNLQKQAHISFLEATDILFSKKNEGGKLDDD